MTTVTIYPLRIKALLHPDQIDNCLKSNNIKLNDTSLIQLLSLHLKNIHHKKAVQVLNKLMSDGMISYNSDEEYEIEDIFDHDFDKKERKTYYLVKWMGWPSLFNTWEPEENLQQCKILDEYTSNIAGRRHKRPRIEQKQSTIRADKTLSELLDQLKNHINVGNVTPEIILSAIDDCYRNRSQVAKCVSIEQPSVARTVLRAKTKQRKRLQPVKRGTKAYAERVLQIQSELRQWEREINEIESARVTGKVQGKITVENKVDLEGPPTNTCGFSYIAECMPGPGVTIPSDPLVGCSCTDCFTERWTCCHSHLEDSNADNCATFPYSKIGLLRVPSGVAVHECNDRCACGPDCSFRVVQRPRKIKVTIYRTKNRGWGVRAGQKLKRGAFVFEYVGEIIANEEAERRGRAYDREAQTYLFDLDFAGDPKYTVDAKNMGNVSHFVNHSCEPNLGVQCVFINCLDYNLPRIALFALRDISYGEELTFDYNMTGSIGIESMDEASSLANNPPSHSRVSLAAAAANMNQSSCCNEEEEEEDQAADEVAPIAASPLFVLPLPPPPLPSPLLSDDQSDRSSDLHADDSSSTVSFSVTGLSSAPSSSSQGGPERIKCLCGAKRCRGWLF